MVTPVAAGQFSQLAWVLLPSDTPPRTPSLIRCSGPHSCSGLTWWWLPRPKSAALGSSAPTSRLRPPASRSTIAAATIRETEGLRRLPSCSTRPLRSMSRLQCGSEGLGSDSPKCGVCIPSNVFCSIWRYFDVSEQSQVSVRIEEAFQIHAKYTQNTDHKKNQVSARYRSGNTCVQVSVRRYQSHRYRSGDTCVQTDT